MAYGLEFRNSDNKVLVNSETSFGKIFQLVDFGTTNCTGLSSSEFGRVPARDTVTVTAGDIAMLQPVIPSGVTSVSVFGSYYGGTTLNIYASANTSVKYMIFNESNTTPDPGGYGLEVRGPGGVLVLNGDRLVTRVRTTLQGTSTGAITGNSLYAQAVWHIRSISGFSEPQIGQTLVTAANFSSAGSVRLVPYYAFRGRQIPELQPGEPAEPKYWESSYEPSIIIMEGK